MVQLRTMYNTGPSTTPKKMQHATNRIQRSKERQSEGGSTHQNNRKGKARAQPGMAHGREEEGRVLPV
jgi:hypothetical protein